MKENKISGLQLGFLIIGFVIGSSTILFPGVGTKQDIWIVLLLGFLGGLILVISYSYISILNPGKTLITILTDVFGKLFGKFVAILYIWYFIHLFSLVLRNFLEFLKVTIFIDTPLLFIAIALISFEVYAVKKGIKAIGRNNVFWVFILCSTLIILFFALMGEFDTNNLFPILENGIKPLIKPTFGVITFPFGELVLFLMVFPSLNKSKSISKISLISVSFGSLIILLILLRNLFTLGPDLISRSIFPSYLAVKLTPKVDAEVFIVMNLLIGGGVKMSICLFSASYGIKQTFGFDSHKPFVIPMAIIGIILSLWLYEDYFEMSKWAKEIYPFYVIPFQILIPLIILIVSIAKNLKIEVK